MLLALHGSDFAPTLVLVRHLFLLIVKLTIFKLTCLLGRGGGVPLPHVTQTNKTDIDKI